MTFDWVHSMAARAAYTGLAAAIPLAALLVAGEVSLDYTLSVVAVATLASIVTSLVSLPEVKGKELPFWKSVLYRSLRTAGQVAAPMLAGVTLLSEVDWGDFGLTVAGAVLVTLLRTMQAYLPEEVHDEEVIYIED